MTGSTTNSDFLKQSYQLNKRTGEPQAFELLRSFGQKFLETQKWPIRKDESWKYTSTQIFTSQNFVPALLHRNTIDESTRISILARSCFKAFANSLDIVFINGVYEPDFSVDNKEQSQTNVRVLNLKNSIVKGLYPILDLSRPKNSFEALNLSFLEEGVFIDIPEKIDFKPIINLIFLSTINDKQTVSLPRVIIKVGVAASVKVFENYESLEESINPQWTNSQVEMHLQDGAKLTWARIQNEADTQLHTCRTKIYLAKNTEFHSLLLTQGANLHRHDLTLEVNGENAIANVHGISLGKNNEHRDHNTLIEFNSGNSKAEQIFKSILHGDSKSIFTGKIIIKQDSQKVDSSQLSQSLILSEKAESNSQPQLEIYADDVKATHGATVGQLNEEELFYFKSRGISEPKAKLMITQGFAMDLVESFPVEEIKAFLREKIKTKLQGFW